MRMFNDKANQHINYSNIPPTLSPSLVWSMYNKYDYLVASTAVKITKAYS